jgi:hypothetical protein
MMCERTFLSQLMLRDRDHVAHCDHSLHVSVRLECEYVSICHH